MWLSVLIFAFFVIVSALQFPLFAFFFNQLPARTGLFRLALAWLSAEYLFPRIFPWEMGHPLIGLLPLVQVADLAGSPFVGFVLLITVNMLVASLRPESLAVLRIKKPLAFFVLFLSAWIGYGVFRLDSFRTGEHPNLKVAIVQANVSTVQQGDMLMLKQNKERYVELSKSISPNTDLIIWPEAIVQDWISIDTTRVQQDPRLPYFGPQHALLTGALTFESQERFFNSAVLINADGSIPSPYHKRILMPFGEYMPFSSIFPWLNTINANLALFTAGKKVEIFDFVPTNPTSTATYLSPLVCYEDLIPSLPRDATRAGAQILVNLTNDAWFGKSLASAHHNMIASFRAIENRRYLIRATNSGQTAVIDAVGESIATLPKDSDGILEAIVLAHSSMTLFSRLLGPWLWWSMSAFVALFSLFKVRRF